jgi:hypothetical protein
VDPISYTDPSGESAIMAAYTRLCATISLYTSFPVIQAFGLGFLQGFMNIVNGAQDIVVGIINL